MSHLFVADESALQGLRRAGRGFSLRGLHVRRLQGQYPRTPLLSLDHQTDGKISMAVYILASFAPTLRLSPTHFFFISFLPQGICVCVCVWMCVYIYIYTYMYMYIYIYVHISNTHSNANKIVALSVQTRASSSRYNYRALYRPCWPTGLRFHVSRGKFEFVFS